MSSLPKAIPLSGTPISSGSGVRTVWSLRTSGGVYSFRTNIVQDLSQTQADVQVTLSNLVPGATVDRNGAPRTTTLTDATHLSVAIPASDLAAAGTVSIPITNPATAASNATQVRHTRPEWQKEIIRRSDISNGHEGRSASERGNYGAGSMPVGQTHCNSTRCSWAHHSQPHHLPVGGTSDDETNKTLAIVKVVSMTFQFARGG